MGFDRWFETTIGEQATLQRGIDITKAQQKPGKVPVVSSSGISSYHDTAPISSPGVVLGRKGVVGSVYYITQDYWPHDTTLWVKDFHGNYPRFVYCFFKSITSQISRMDVGSANPTLNRNHVHPIKVVWPPLEEQKAIAHILGTLDDKIELNQQMNRTLEDIARAIFKSWFIDFDPVRAKMEGRQPAGMDAETAALFPDEFEDSPLGKIPKGWRVSTIDEATSLIIDHRGKTPKKLGGDWSNDGIPVLSAKNIKGGRLIRTDAIRYINQELYDRWMKISLANGDILMTSEAPLGELLYLFRQELYCLGQRLYGIRANQQKCQPAYLFYTLASDDIQARLIGRSTGTTVEGIRQSELRKVDILLPNIENQKTFSAIVETSLGKIYSNEEQNATLTSIRDILLPKLLSGEIRIKDTEKIVEEVV